MQTIIQSPYQKLDVFYYYYSYYTMNIDTLIISGGGPSGMAHIGVFKSLIDNNIIDENFVII